MSFLLLLLDPKRVWKAAEKLMIKKTVTKTILSQVTSNYQKSKESAAEEGTSIKENLESASEEIVDSMRGKLGRQVNEAIKKEGNKIDELLDNPAK